ncbi:MAG: CARDB domain-containing protein [Methylococcales bacterium]|nr:CARDB domain-containing protein [Methylococcales bacterium]
MKTIYLQILAMTLLAVNITFAADEIHWTVTGKDSVTFDWRGTSAENSIGYGLTSGNYTQVTATTPNPVPVSSTGPFWEAKLTGLAANTRYYYKIGNAPERSFRTLPASGSSDFTVYAQGNIGSSSNYFNTGVIQDIIANDLPSFVIGLGDLTLGSINGKAVVDQHFNDVMVWSKEAAYMPVWGDQDTITTSTNESFKNYKGRFAVPNPQTSPGSPLAGGEDWHWFDYGNVRFITLPEPWTGAWADWNTKAGTLMAQAQADPNIKFIVTFVHRPAYSSGHYTGSSTLKSILDNLGDTYSKYKLNINAHSNNYERSFPQHGVIHVTAGTGGANLTQDGACLWLTCTKPSWSAFRAMHLGVLKLHFTASGIGGSFICGPAGGGINDLNCTKGSVLDNFTIGSSLPDVIVTSVSYANGIFTSTVKNQGISATPAGTIIGIGYSVDGVWKTWGSVNGPLAAGASVTIGTSGAPFTIPTGTHTINAYVDDINRFAESDETNNQITQSITIGSTTSLPDVFITSISYANGIFTSTVKNQGTAATPASTIIGVGYSVDGVWKTWGSVGGPLAAGASVTIGTGGAPFTIPTGTHTINAYVDDINRFAESTETNNQLNQSITVGSTTSLPDVIVTSVSYANGIFTSTVKNQGTAATPSGTLIGVGYSVDGVWRTSGSVGGPLAAGVSVTIGTSGAPYTIPTGTHMVNANVDDINRFAESNETNNQLSITNNQVSAGGTTDTQVPTTPVNLKSVAISSSQISLSWTASTDNVGVTGYKVFRKGVQIATVTGISYSDTGLTSNTAYSYTVSAYDAAGNNSAQSSSVSSTTSNGGSSVSNPFFGFAGHFWGPYANSSATTLLDLVQKAGAGIYRVDLKTDTYALTDALLSAAATRNIKLLAILQSPDSTYTSAFNEAKAFATKYAGRISYYQISNEQDLATGTIQGDGALPTDYDNTLYAQAKTRIQGLLDGVRAGDPSAKAIINFTWLHYGFIQRLINDGIKFDIIGIDWYSNMGDIANVRGNFNLPVYLKSQFGKPLWVNEGNRWEGSTGGNETAQATYISQITTAMCNNPNINAYIVYELLDEPGASPEFEKHMGLLYTPATEKPAFNAYKQAIAGCQR